MKTIRYITKGTCSRAIEVMLDDAGVIKECSFIGGCPGNTKGLGSLVVGMSSEEAIKRLKGIRCGNKQTSCPDQLAKALEKG